MRENYYFSMESSFPFKSQSNSEYQSKRIHPNHTYIFPNSLQLQKHNHFKTSLDLPKKQMADHYTKKLSMYNRNPYVVSLKQIKKEDNNDPLKIGTKLFLYYELVPYSLQYAKEGPVDLEVSINKFQRMLRDLFGDLIQSNIYCLVDLNNCGFTQVGELRVYVPPTTAFRDKKLTATEKQAVFKSCQQLLFYYESDIPKSIETIPVEVPSKPGRFNSPLPSQKVEKVKDEQKNRKESDIDVKKTLKLTKAGVPEFLGKMEEAKAKVNMAPLLKKAKSMEVILKEEPQKETVKWEHRKSQNYKDKINELNRKLHNIKESFNRKRSAGEQLQKLKQKQSADFKAKRGQEEVIYDFYNQTGNNIDKYQVESVDTYDQEMNNEYYMPSFKPNQGIRRTTLPRTNTDQGIRRTTLPRHMTEEGFNQEETKKEWNHESAGNVMFKKILQKNRQAYPELFEGDKVDHSKISTPQQPTQSQISAVSPNRLKKMMSMETFDYKFQTNSVHMSDYSKQLSNVKRRKEKELKGKEIKDKVKDILLKSKRAIELLRAPGRFNS